MDTYKFLKNCDVILNGILCLSSDICMCTLLDFLLKMPKIWGFMVFDQKQMWQYVLGFCLLCAYYGVVVGVFKIAVFLE